MGYYKPDPDKKPNQYLVFVIGLIITGGVFWAAYELLMYAIGL